MALKSEEVTGEKKKTDSVPVAENIVSPVIKERCKDLIPLSNSIDFVEDVFVASSVDYPPMDDQSLLAGAHNGNICTDLIVVEKRGSKERPHKTCKGSKKAFCDKIIWLPFVLSAQTVSGFQSRGSRQHSAE